MTDPKVSNSTTLPSISHLLNPTSQERIESTAGSKNATSLIDPSDPTCSKQNQAYSTMKLLQDYPSPPLSSSALDYPTSSIPPLQGNDPPPRHTRTISNDSDSTITSLSDTQHSYQRFSRWGTSPTMQYFPSRMSAPWTVPKHKDAVAEALSPAVSKPSIQVNPSTSERLETPAPTRLSFTSTGEPILKRRRGRPPSNAREACTWEGGWTFLSPTVWSVNNNNSNQVTAPPSTTTLPVSSPSPGQQNNQPRKTLDAAATSQQQQPHSGAISDIAAFSSSDLSNVMHMPKRKRGRKPKKHLVGHSCFVWKDIPIVRSPLSTAKARATAAANRLRKEKERQEQQKQKQQENVLVVDDNNKVHHEDSC